MNKSKFLLMMVALFGVAGLSADGEVAAGDETEEVVEVDARSSVGGEESFTGQSLFQGHDEDGDIRWRNT